jgi:hypothetical protein
MDSDISVRTIERLRAYEHAKEMFGGGAIEIGGLRHVIGQIAQEQLGRINFMLSAMHAKMQRSSINREGHHAPDLPDSRLLPALENNRKRIDAANVAKMSKLEYWTYQYGNNSAKYEFHHSGWYEYKGSVEALHGTWLSHEINYFPIGEAAAAHHESLAAMDRLIGGWTSGRGAVRGMGATGGEWLWARVGYGYYYANRAMEGGY